MMLRGTWGLPLFDERWSSMYQAPYVCPCGDGVLVAYDARNKPEKTQLDLHIESCESCKWILSWWGGSYDNWIKDGTDMERIADERHKKVMEELQKQKDDS